MTVIAHRYLCKPGLAGGGGGEARMGGITE